MIGQSDTGKTSLVTDLANRWLATGGPVAIVDADIGQSEIGPPTTIGLGRVVCPLNRPAEAEPLALAFVGSTSPVGNLLPTVVGTRRMVDRALAAGLGRVIVDTSGLVAGELGQVLKQAKIDLVAPDAVVALSRGDECEAILRRYDAGRRPRVVRLPALAEARRRSAEERRLHRERALAAHFAGARAVDLVLDRLAVRGRPRGEAAGLLVGLEDADREMLGLGRVLALDHEGGRLELETAVAIGQVTAVTFGRERWPTPP